MVYLNRDLVLTSNVEFKFLINNLNVYEFELPDDSEAEETLSNYFKQLRLPYLFRARQTQVNKAEMTKLAEI